MRTSIRVLVAAGCVVWGLSAVAAAGPVTYQTTNLFRAGNPAVFMPGAATLYRSRQDLELRVAAGGLAMHTSYTVWWVVFNNPAACAASCGATDLENPAVRAAVFYAAGFVTGAGDSGNVSAHVTAGNLPAGVAVESGFGLEHGNGFGAEVHVVIRSHGLTNPGMVAQQIASFGGGCNPTCANVQAGVFPALR